MPTLEGRRPKGNCPKCGEKNAFQQGPIWIPGDEDYPKGQLVWSCVTCTFALGTLPLDALIVVEKEA